MTTWNQILDAYDALHPEITILAEASQVEELQAQVDAADLPARVTVKPSPYVPEGQMLVVNHTETRRVSRDAAVRGTRGEQS